MGYVYQNKYSRAKISDLKEKKNVRNFSFNRLFNKNLLNHGLFQLVNKCNLIDDDSIKRLT